MKLDEKGRCCGRKPIHYRSSRDNVSGCLPRPSKFCGCCDRAFDPDTGCQIENWAWRRDRMGIFRSTDWGERPWG